MKLNASYAFLHSELSEVQDVSNYILSRNNTLVGLDLRALPVGSEIPNAVPHKLVLEGAYTLPMSESVGKLTLGATMVYTSEYRTSSEPPVLANPCPSATVNTNINLFNCSAAVPAKFASGDYGVLPESTVLNLTANWENVLGHPVDIGAFVTNVAEEKTYPSANVQAGSGFVSNIVGEPRMWGVRMKYRFGG